MKKNKCIIPFTLCVSVLLSSASCAPSNQIVVFTALEDYRMAELQRGLNQQFPEKNIVLQYLDTGTLISRIANEGNNTACDILVGIESTNAEYLLNQKEGIFQDLSSYDTSMYLDDLLRKIPNHNGLTPYHIFDKEAGAIILNTEVLAQNNLPEPKSYTDLLNPIYRNLIMMPNPKHSGTGYYFLNGFVSSWGETAAFEYVNSLVNNIKEFSTSGSGPVKALDRGEIAIGLGMTFQAVKYANENPNLKVVYFDEGSPYTLYTNAVINGRFSKPGVKEVYDYIYNIFTPLDKALFVPEIIYKPEYQPDCEIPNYPTNVKYVDMIDIFDFQHKYDLLEKWKY